MRPERGDLQPLTMPSPEKQARKNIDRMLAKSGWAVRDQNNAHISAYQGLAIRNFTLKQGHGFRTGGFDLSSDSLTPSASA